jgi:Ala-tRNA(Pro) deacylase
MTVATRIKAKLDAGRVAYEVISHPIDGSAPATAAHTHTPGREFAKAVVVRAGKGYAMVVAPAHHRIDLSRVGEVIGQPEAAALATEDEIAHLCPDCERGAVPPFGNLYGLPVVVSDELSREPRITFNAGSHAEAIRMRYQDWATLVKPRVAHISSIPRDGDPSSPQDTTEAR